MIKITPDMLPLKGCVVTVGNFDGIHLGHIALIEETKRVAAELGVPSLVLTFDVHPRNYFGGADFRRVVSLEVKERLVAALGADCYYELDFAKVTDMDAREFCETVLIGQLGVRHAVCGHDFKFGRRGSADAGVLADLLRGHGAGCTVLPPVTDAEGKRISSTGLRALIASGDMEGAARLLGRPYALFGRVETGEQLGRALGFPTANIRLDGRLATPPFGVYVAACLAEGRWYPAVVNLGVKPTVKSEGEPLCECHLMDYSGDLYGKELQIRLYKRLRAEKRFSSLEELTEQIRLDKQQARSYVTEGGFIEGRSFEKEIEI